MEVVRDTVDAQQDFDS